MKIGFIWHCSYPWDVRLEKLMKVCAQKGYSVSLLCRGKDALPQYEISEGIRIWRMYGPAFLGSRKIGRIAAFPLFFNPFWIAAMIRFLRAEQVDLLIVRDLPFAFVVGTLGKLFRTPVILDMAENYPAALVAYQRALYKLFLFRRAWLPKQYERLSLKLMSHTLVVTSEQVERLKLLGVSASRVTVVGNTPEVCFVPPQSVSACDNQWDNNRGDNLLYVGKIDAHRGVDLLVRAMPALLEEFPHLTLTLVGDGTRRLQLENLVRALGIESSVNLPGWVKFERIWSYITQSTICLIPHVRNEHTNTTLPNKLFDYMAMSKPVVASDCVPLERIIRETGSGLTFASGDLTDLDSKLRALLSNPELRTMMGRNGRRAVEESYNWELDTRALLAAIQSASCSTCTRQKNLIPA